MPEHCVESATPAAEIEPAAIRDSGAFADVALFADTLVPHGGSVQRKLQVGAEDDPLEHEADRVAEQVVRMPAPPMVQRKCGECEEEDHLCPGAAAKDARSGATDDEHLTTLER